MLSEERDFGARMFAALASAARLHILERLSEGPSSVKELSEATDLKQSMTSQHLAVLLSAGVVVCTAEGNLRIYSLRGPRIARILELVEEFYNVHLEGLRRVVARHFERTLSSARMD